MAVTRRTAGAVMTLCAWAGAARAQDDARQDDARPAATLQVRVDNDLLSLRGAGPPPDYDYTHGTRVGVAWPGAPAWIARALRAAPRCSSVADACLLSGVAAAQEIYTPRHNEPEPVAGDRPYGAWLYGSAQLRRRGRAGLHALELRVGVTGPAALGEPVQNGVHRLLHNHLEAGWSHQLPTRLAVAVDYDRTLLLAQGRSSAPSRFVAGSLGATLGTVRRAAHAELTAHSSFGGARAPTADAALVTRPGRFHVAAGYRQTMVMHDVFVEGAGETPGGKRIPWVGEASAAAGWRVGRVAAEYRYVSRGREYRAEPGRHAYGSLALSVLLR